MIKIKTSSEQIYDYIVRQIEIGELTPNTKLSEAELIETFGTSRTPIREALIKLTADGIVTNANRKGFYVKDFARRDVSENYFIIACLDAYAAVLALDTLTDDDIRQMEIIEKRLEYTLNNQDYELYHDEQFAFHDVYYKKCGNKSLVELILSLQHKYVRTSWFGKSEEDNVFAWLLHVNEDHKELIRCFKEKDKEKLISVVFAHWVSTKTRPDQL